MKKGVKLHLNDTVLTSASFILLSLGHFSSAVLFQILQSHTHLTNSAEAVSFSPWQRYSYLELSLVCSLPERLSLLIAVMPILMECWKHEVSLLFHPPHPDLPFQLNLEIWNRNLLFSNCHLHMPCNMNQEHQCSRDMHNNFFYSDNCYLSTCNSII